MDTLKKSYPIFGLIGLCGLIFFCRLHTYDEPLERDLTTYAVIAHEMLNGKSLYSELWDHKPPAIHVTYAAAELVAGYGRNSILLMNVVAGIATLFACYFAGTAAGGGRLGGFIAAALWAVISGDLALEGNQPNTEVFLNACLAAAFAIFVCRKNNGHTLSFRAVLGCGLLFGVASLYKQVAIFYPILLGVAYLISTPVGSRKKAFGDVATIGGLGALLWLLVLGYFAVRGHAAAFIDDVFKYNRWYSANTWQKNLVDRPHLISPDALTILLCLGIPALAGGVLGFIYGPRRPWILLIAFAVATQIAVLLPGGFFQHYYQLLLPPLIIGAGWAVANLRTVLPVRLNWLAYATSIVAVLTFAFMEAPCYRDHAEVWSLKKYGATFLETDKLARRIDNMLLPNETFYEWGNETGLYFTSKRRPPSGITFVYPIQEGPFATALSARLLGDLQETKPEILVLSRPALDRIGAAGSVILWCKQNYRLFSDTGLFYVLARKGGRLDADQALAKK
jgi:4-amino-4-deoxy-L-arabinose transferase-like glycosyltransferase